MGAWIPGQAGNDRKVPIAHIRVLTARAGDAFKIELAFSDGTRGVFDVGAYLSTRSGPLLEPLRKASYLKRVFIDAGALCWPNGLEIAPARLHELCKLTTPA